MGQGLFASNGRTSRAERSALNLESSPPRATLALCLAVFCFAALGVPAPASADTGSGANAPAMMVPGQFNVSATGAATYTIPISVPPGTAGMVPALSLDYSSQNGDGTLGLGWTLSGLPSIGRCPRTVAQDSLHGGVNYDANDRFCMEGQRLMVIGGTYGADGSEYRTETESFSKILAHGVAGNGPSWFEVHLKTGQVLQLGNTTDSRILAVGKTTARLWTVNKITDTKGNYLTVTYTNDTTNGQFYPTRIDYTGNTGLATYNSVRFTYNTARPDVIPTYQAGSLVQIKVLLTDIKTYNNNTVINDYKIAYELGTTLRHSRVTSVTLCDASTTCLAPATFGWQGSRDTLTVTATSNILTQNYGLVSGDFNGDGLVDAVELTTLCPSGGIVYSGSQSGTFSSGNMTAQYDYYPVRSTNVIHYNSTACLQRPDGAVGDINGDGFSDLAIDIWVWTCEPDPETGCDWIAAPSAEVLRNDGAGHLIQVTPDATYAYPFVLTRSSYSVVADFNGDGRADGFEINGSAGYAYFSNGDGTYTQDGGHTSLAGGGNIGDFDGDGCTDMLAQGTTNAIVYFCQPATTQATVSNWTSDTLVYGDFNGDGKTDILAVIPSANAQLFLATGTGLTTAYTITGSTTWSSYQVVTGDWNGDGKMDVALISHTSGQPHLIFLSTGTGFTQITTIANTDASSYAVVADWNNDGADDLWIKKNTGDTEYTFSFVPERLATISNGLGATTTVTYDRLNKNGTFYTKGTGAIYPVRDVDAPQYAVSRVDTANGIGGTYSWTYAYAGEKADQSGRGGLGFQQFSATDLQTGIVTATTFRQDFPYIGRVATQTVKSGSITLASVTNTYAATNLGGTRNFVYLQTSVVARNDLDNSAFPTVTTNYTYDSYGNPLTIARSWSGGSSTTTNTFTNDTTNWVLGQVATTNVQNIVGTSNLTRHFSFAHQTGSGLITQQIAEPNTPSLKLQADIGLDNFGNRTGITLSGQSITTRTTGLTYDNKGEFATRLTNALNQQTNFVLNAGFGETTSATDPNNVVAGWTYDTLGRNTLLTKPDGTKLGVAYYFCSGVNGGTLSSCPTYGAYGVQMKPLATDGVTLNGPTIWTYYDALNRPITVDKEGFDGAGTGCTLSAPCWIRTATQYDALGRVWKTSRPYFISGGTAKWTVNSFDTLGRVTQATFPDNSHVTYAFHGLSSTVTNALNQAVTTLKNNQGLVASVTDAAGRITTYAYDAFGDLLTITDPSGNAIANIYDLRGRKLSSADPDMGTWLYGYDVLNELTSQTNAVGNQTTLSYDVLGRLAQRVEADLTSTWTYDTAPHGVGKLASAGTNGGYSRTLSYDSVSRPTTTQVTIGGNIYSVVTAYDANGHIGSVTYPSGFVAQYGYTAMGYQYQLLDGFSGQVYWTATSADAELHTLTQIAGNGITTTEGFDANTGRLTAVQAGTGSLTANFAFAFDAIGNVTQRQDLNEALTENFCYDNLNRLTNYAVDGVDCTHGSVVKSVGYDIIGNLSTKSDIGSYSYPAAGQSRPHAVSSITGTVNGVINPAFGYDSDGNMTAGAGRSVTYTSFDMVSAITQGSTTLSYTYDCDHNRIQQTAPEGTTVYVNDRTSGVFIEKFFGASLTQWNDYLFANGKMVGVHFALSDGTTLVRYSIADHLGSTSVLSDETGAVAERDSYDAWGMRRNPNGSDASGITSQTTRGFTGQEHIADVGLINYNARIYDPAIGRFMSADSIVPAAFDGQSFNRYSYVVNNPLSFIDPTGHDETVEVWGTRKPQQDGGGGGPMGGMSAGGGITGTSNGGSVDSEPAEPSETVVVTASRVHAHARSSGPQPPNASNSKCDPGVVGAANAMHGIGHITVILGAAAGSAGTALNGMGLPVLGVPLMEGGGGALAFGVMTEGASDVAIGYQTGDWSNVEHWMAADALQAGTAAYSERTMKGPILNLIEAGVQDELDHPASCH